MTSHILIIVSAAALVIGVALLVGTRRAAFLTNAASPTAAKRTDVIKPLYFAGAVAGAGLGWAVIGGGFVPVIGAAVGTAAAVWLQRRVPSQDAARQRQLVAEFPLVLGFLAAVVESGAPVRFAAEAVADVADAENAQRLRNVLARCDVGFTDAEAWRTLADDPVWGDVARELARCVITGAATGEVLRTTATQARKTAAAAAITQARSVGVASTLPLVCCFLPAFLLVGVVPIIGGLIGGYMTNF
ncbi:MAG: type II secretion system F family protein [Propionibacteriaceae bacterium]|nr:type II secretion system F family protein [Propionibacteriaceae bacterium]